MGDSHGPRLIAITAFFLTLSWIFVLLRCFCRTVLVKGFGLDDIFCLIAQVLFTAYCVATAVSVANGMGRHIADIPPSHIPLALKWTYLSDPFYVFSNMFLKFSIGVFLLRICISKLQRAVIWCVMVVSGVVCVYFCLIVLFQCTPVSYFWERVEGAKGTCMNSDITSASTYAYTAMSCWSDWTYCILPTFMIWKLQMNPRTKLGVCLILGVSSIASVITIVRIPSISALHKSNDFLYTITELTSWSLIETGLALVACSCATLRPLFQLFNSKFDSLVPSDIPMDGSDRATNRNPWSTQVRYSRNGTRIDNYDVKVQTNIGTNAAGHGSGGNPHSRWPEDDLASGADTDGVSNSSQTNLKTDEEAGLAAAKSSSGITKTVVVSSRAVRI